MTPQELVDGIRAYVMETAVSKALSTIETPPGQAPDPQLIELSRWFSELSEKERAMLRNALGLTARSAVFGLLCVLDGARKVVDAQPGDFELSYVHDAGRDVLCGPAGAILHELL